MQAKILTKEQEGLWTEFVKSHPFATIHQAPEWGRFQAEIPARGKYWIVVLEDVSQEKPKIIGGTVLIKHSLPKGYSWLYSARGPLLDYKSKNISAQVEVILKEIEKIAKKERSIFLRVDPPNDSFSDKHAPLSPFDSIKGFKPTKFGFQPEHTLIIDLTLPEEDILKQMKQKGRYNIKLAERKKVEIKKTNIGNLQEFKKDLSDFYKILEETTKRDKFTPHNKDYYEKMLKNLNTPESEKATLYLATYNGKAIAGLIATFFKDTATYYYGASSNQHRNLMAPYLLQWTAIKDAKEQGFQYYDFLGIAPKEAKNHPWRGVTEFKTKLGGFATSHPQAMELPFKKLHYMLYKLYKIVRKVI